MFTAGCHGTQPFLDGVCILPPPRPPTNLDLDKLNLVKLAYGGKGLGSS